MSPMVGSAFEPGQGIVRPVCVYTFEELVGADGTALLSFDEFWDAYRRFT